MVYPVYMIGGHFHSQIGAALSLPLRSNATGAPAAFVRPRPLLARLRCGWPALLRAIGLLHYRPLDRGLCIMNQLERWLALTHNPLRRFGPQHRHILVDC